MQLAEKAMLSQQARRYEHAIELFREAFQYERRAAIALAHETEFEPTRSVLLRSAASLALKCGESREAERLVSIGLMGDPPPEIAEELRDLIEQVHFERHLELRGVKLEPGEFQMSLWGKGVGYGIAPTDAVIERIAHTEKLLIRLAEKRAGRSFRESGSAPRDLKQGVELFMSMPRAASYAVTFRVGRPADQLDLPSLLGTPEAIDELLNYLVLFQEQRTDDLRSQIEDDAYFNNFVALARRIAPDGEEITGVGFTSGVEGRAKTVQLTPRIKPPAPAVPRMPKQEVSPAVSVTGQLLFADERHGAHNIRLVDESGVEHRIKVPPGMMADIVKPLWQETVTVTGTQRGSTIHLEDISAAG